MVSEPLDLDAIRASLPPYRPEHWSAPRTIAALCDELEATRTERDAAAEGNAWWKDMAGQHSRRADRAEAALARIEPLLGDDMAYESPAVLKWCIRRAIDAVDGYDAYDGWTEEPA